MEIVLVILISILCLIGLSFCPEEHNYVPGKEDGCTFNLKKIEEELHKKYGR